MNATQWRFGQPIRPAYNYLIAICFLVGSGFLWEVRGGGVLSQPSMMITTFLSEWSRVLQATFATGQKIIVGVVAGAPIGVLLGAGMASWHQLSRLWQGVVTLPIVLPNTAVSLVLVGWLGFFSPWTLYIMMGYAISVFMSFMTYWAVRQCIESPAPATVIGTQLIPTRTGVVWHCIMPQIQRQLVSYLAYASMGMWAFMLFAEPLVAPVFPGIGNFTYYAADAGWWSHLWVGIAALTTGGLITASIVLVVGRWLAR